MFWYNLFILNKGMINIRFEIFRDAAIRKKIVDAINKYYIKQGFFLMIREVELWHRSNHRG